MPNHGKKYRAAKSVTPFPGAELLAGPEVMLLNGAGFIIPAYAKAEAKAKAQTEPAQRIQEPK